VCSVVVVKFNVHPIVLFVIYFIVVVEEVVEAVRLMIWFVRNGYSFKVLLVKIC
jgi:hypothetical protein